MLSKKLFSLLHKIALFAIIFASIAPSISHALAAENGQNSFVQEICTTNGEKITIQVLTTKGKQLATELATTSSDKPTSGIQHHLQHCPFCANPNIDVGFAAPHAPILALLTAQARHIAATSQVAVTRFSVLPPPSQAPPVLL